MYPAKTGILNFRLMLYNIEYCSNFFTLGCECNSVGSEDGECNRGSDGNCKCKEGYSGIFCDKCDTTYYGFPNCKGKNNDSAVQNLNGS